MSPRTSRRVDAISAALRNVAGGLLMAGSFIGLLWAFELAFVA